MYNHHFREAAGSDLGEVQFASSMSSAGWNDGDYEDQNDDDDEEDIKDVRDLGNQDQGLKMRIFGRWVTFEVDDKGM